MDANEPIISVSGLRGIVGHSLTPANAVPYVAAFATWLKQHGGVETSRNDGEPPRVVVARDGRDSGPMLMHCVESTLMACGVDVLNAGLAATPTVGVLVQDWKADGAVQISASHNPPPYNGMKLFGRDGRVIPAHQGEQVLQRFQQGDWEWCEHQNLGTGELLEDTTTAHLNKILATVNVSAIQEKRFRVVLDSNHACGSILGRRLLERLHCDFVLVGDTPDGQFDHPPEPTEANLAGVTRLALENHAQVVFCQDPDADRLAIIDEKGNYIGEEYTLAITLNHALQHRKGPVVTNCSSSRMTLDLANQYGVTCHLSKVGEANVTDQMLKVNAVYGGEGSGGPIDPRVGFVRDSFVGMAQTLDAMAQSGKSISELVAELPHYSIHKTTVALGNSLPRAAAVQLAMEQLDTAFQGEQVSRLDGFRVDWDDAWLLVRPSNTEPIVRAVAEATTAERAAALCQQASDILESGR